MLLCRGKEVTDRNISVTQGAVARESCREKQVYITVFAPYHLSVSYHRQLSFPGGKCGRLNLKTQTQPLALLTPSQRQSARQTEASEESGFLFRCAHLDLDFDRVHPQWRFVAGFSFDQIAWGL